MRTIIITDDWIDVPIAEGIEEIVEQMTQDDILNDLYRTVPFAISNHYFLHDAKMRDQYEIPTGYTLIVTFEDSDYIPKYLHKYIIRPSKKSDKND